MIEFGNHIFEQINNHDLRWPRILVEVKEKKSYRRKSTKMTVWSREYRNKSYEDLIGCSKLNNKGNKSFVEFKK